MNKSVFKILFILISVILLSSCGGSKQKSNTTGWNYNDEKQGGFQVVDNYQQETPIGMVFVEGGTFTMGRVEEDILYDWNNVPRRVTVSSFYMDQYEVSNLDWQEYIHWMKLVFASAPELVAKALPDTTVWREGLAYNEPYVQYYFSHVAYHKYPVVGVSWEQAMDYCIWRGDRVNEIRLNEAGIINLPDYQSLKSNPDITDIAENQVFNTDKYQQSPAYEPAQGKKPMKTMSAVHRTIICSTCKRNFLVIRCRYETTVL